MYKSGIYKQQLEYKSFSPSFINKNYSWSDQTINILLEEASRSLGNLNVSSDFALDLFK